MIKTRLLQQHPPLSICFLSTLLLTWSSLSLAAGSASEARQLLERMSAALQDLSYQGIFVYRRDEDLAAMKVIHLAHKEGERELLQTLTGEPRETVRDSHRFGLMGQQVEGRLAQVEGYYQLAPVSHDRVAGRDTKLIAVAPRDQYRYGYRLWIDEKTGLLLKSDLLGEQGDVYLYRVDAREGEGSAAHRDCGASRRLRRAEQHFYRSLGLDRCHYP